MFLLFNKIDLFREKLKTTPVSSIYESFQGPDVKPGNLNLDEAFEAAREFFLQRFLQRVQHDNRDNRYIYRLFTSAIDTRHFKAVFDTIADIVIRYAFPASRWL